MISSEASVHPLAVVEPGVKIGPRSRVWQFCVILPGAAIGADCNICAHCLIEAGVSVGARVTVKSGVYLWVGLTVEDDVFIGPAAVFTNDLRPRSKQYPPEFRKTLLKQGCSIGANATVMPGLTIGRWAMIAAGSVVTRNVADFALVVGNPGRQRGWVCRCGLVLGDLSGGSVVCGCGRAYQLRPDQTVTEAGA